MVLGVGVGVVPTSELVKELAWPTMLVCWLARDEVRAARADDRDDASLPVAATAWLATICAGLCALIVTGGGSLGPQALAAIVIVAALGVAGASRVSRWAFRQIEMNAKVGGKSEEAALLLREYEQRGAGWLWQVDADNRVTYISSRMTAMVGKSTGQLLGHSLPASLGASSNLGQALLARLPFSALEMEIKTPGGPRWISIAGDPIVGPDGAFDGFRGVGLLLLPWLLSDTVHPSMVLFIVIYGLDWVATVPPTVALCRRIFGDRGTIVFGWVFASHQIGAAAAALAAGVIRDTLGSYTYAWVGGACLCAVAAVLSISIRRAELEPTEPNSAPLRDTEAEAAADLTP